MKDFSFFACTLLRNLCPLFMGLLFSAPAMSGEASWHAEPGLNYSKSSEIFAGRPAKCFEWKRADFDGNRDTKGSEILSGRIGLNDSYVYTADIYFDSKSFGGDKAGVIISQLHGTRDKDLGERFRNPIWALAYESGNIYFRYKSSLEKVTPFVRGKFQFSSADEIDVGKPKMDSWNHVVISGKDSIRGDGYISVKVNNFSFEKNNINIGYNDERGGYFKYGVYYYAGTSDYSARSVCFSGVSVAINR